MAKGKAEDKSQTHEEKAAEVESKRLRELALSRGLLSQSKAIAAAPLRPQKGIVRCDGKDIVKKGHRKNKYLFAFPGLVAPVAGGKFGDLTQLDSRNPVLYIDFSQGRLKLFGTIVYPKNKYLTLNFLRGAGNIICEDCFESLVVFPEAWWIGTKEENPDELRLDMPQNLQQEKHAVFDFAAGAGKPGDPKEDVEVQLTQLEQVQSTPQELSKENSPKGQLTMEQLWLLPKKPLESNEKVKPKPAEFSESDDEDRGIIHLQDTPTPVRQSARTAGKKYMYTESASEEDETEDSSASDGLDEKRKKRTPGGKAVNKLFTSKDPDNGIIGLESQASKQDLAGPSNGNFAADKSVTLDVDDAEDLSAIDHFAASQTLAARTTAAGSLISPSMQSAASANASRSGAKQSSLSAFFMKSSEKEKVVTFERSASVVETGFIKKYTRKKITKSTVDEEENAEKEEEDLTETAKTESVLQFTPPGSNGSQRKRKAASEGKQTPKGAGEKSKSPAKRRKKVSDDSDAG